MGTSLGVIRVFDLETEEELKPILVRELHGNRVTCIDVSQNGMYLAAGYSNGQIVLWELKTSTAAVQVGDAHNCTVLNAKFLKGSRPRIISSDVGGSVYITEFTKAILGLTSTSTLMLKSRIGFALAPLHQGTLCQNLPDDLVLIAIGSVNNIVVAAMEPTVRVLWEFKRRLPIQKGIPYIDWGRGLLPDRAENDSIVMAIAWDKVIQLVEILNPGSELEGYSLNGYLECDCEIRFLRWVAESTIVILTAKNELRVLYTGRFVPGRYTEEDPTMRAAAEKVKGEVPDLEPPYLVEDELAMQGYNIGRPSTSEQQVKNSYHQTIMLDGRKLVGLGKNTVVMGKVLAWNECMENQKGRSQWIEALRTGREIFLGRLKGLAELPENKTAREAAVLAFVKGFVRDGLREHLEKSDSGINREANIMQMQITIEFCIAISAFDYLFTDLLSQFAEYNLESAFLDSLEPYILSGRLSLIPLPPTLLSRLISHYVSGGNLGTLERVLIFLNLEGQDLDALSAVCVIHKMFSAGVCLKALQGGERNFVEPAIFMHNEMNAMRKERRNVDMRMISARDPDTSLVLTKTYGYLGYKLLWYIRLCFKGERFGRQPESTIPRPIWPGVVCALLNWLFVQHEEDRVTNLQELMQLDVRSVFQVLSLLFEEEGLRSSFIVEPQTGRGTKEGLSYQKLIARLASVAGSMDSESTRSLHYYNLFLANVSAQAGNTIAPELCVSTVSYLCWNTSSSGQGESLSQNEERVQPEKYEDIVLRMIRNCPGLAKEQINELIKEVQLSPYTEVLVYLTQLKGDYLKCFETYLGLKDASKKERVFDWLATLHDSLPESDPSHPLIQKLINEQIEKLVLLVC